MKKLSLWIIVIAGLYGCDVLDLDITQTETTTTTTTTITESPETSGTSESSSSSTSVDTVSGGDCVFSISFPLELTGTPPEYVSFSGDCEIPDGVTQALVEMTVYDADNEGELSLEINEVTTLSLLASQVSSDGSTVNIAWAIDASDFTETTSFILGHLTTSGFIVNGMAITFE